MVLFSLMCNNKTMSTKNKVNKFKLILIAFVIFDAILAAAIIVILNSTEIVTTYNTAEEYKDAIAKTKNPETLAKLRINYAKFGRYKFPPEDTKDILDEIDFEKLDEADKAEYYNSYREYYVMVGDDENYQKYNRLLGDFLDSSNLNVSGGA